MNKSILLLCGFLDLFGASMIVTQLQPYLKSIGFSPTVSGLVGGSVYGGVQLFSSPFVGRVADVRGARGVLLLCLLLSAASYCLLSSSTCLTVLVLARVAAGMFKHSQTLSRTYQTVLLSSEELPHWQGTFNAVSGIGFIIGPPVAGHIIEDFGGFPAVTYVVAAICLLQALVLLLFLPETPPGTALTNIESTSAKQESDKNNTGENSRLSSPDSQTVGAHFKMIWGSALWHIFTIRLFHAFSALVVHSNRGLFLTEHCGLSPSAIGYVTSVGGIVGTCSGFVAGPLIRRYCHEWRLLSHILIVWILAVCGLTLAPNAWVYTLFVIPFSMTNSFSRVVQTTLTLRCGSKDEVGILLGLSQSTLSVARLLSAAIAGVAMEISVYGPGIVAIVTGSVALVAAVHRTWALDSKRKVE